MSAAATIRPLDARADRQALVDALDRLSPASRYLRFGGPKPRFTAREVAWMLEVDRGRREALVAVEPCGRIVGVGHLVATGDDAADVAVFVTDDWQGRGVGAALLEALHARAAAAGLRVLHADVLAENRRAARALRRAGYARRGTGSLVAYERLLAG
jgi:RimJ/RimL family protein N-acetyltransferase